MAGGLASSRMDGQPWWKALSFLLSPDFSASRGCRLSWGKRDGPKGRVCMWVPTDDDSATWMTTLQFRLCPPLPWDHCHPWCWSGGLGWLRVGFHLPGQDRGWSLK